MADCMEMAVVKERRFEKERIEPLNMLSLSLATMVGQYLEKKKRTLIT